MSVTAKKRMKPLAAALVLTLFAGLPAASSIAMEPGVMAAHLAVAATPHAVADAPEHATASRSIRYTALDGNGRARYIVILKEAPVASYEGETAGLSKIPQRAAAARPTHPDMQSPAALQYVAHLQQVQTRFLSDISATFARTVEPVMQYQHALNGIAVDLTAEEAEELRQRDDVSLVDREKIFKPVTYATPTFIGAPTLWNDSSAPNGSGYKGEGIVIGSIDSGVNYLSNSFKATGDDGYTPVNPLGSGNYLGQCATGRGDAGRCNSKLIGMYNLDAGGVNASGRDLNGHGSHTASTAGGNVTNGAPFAGGTFNVSGIAPHANIIAYMACGNCTQTGLNGAINQAVANGIVDVINYSIGGPNDGPWLDSTDQAFLGAMNAGIFVATAAGNDGPGAGTTDSYAPWYTTVAATTPNALPGFGLTVPGWTGTAAMVSGAPPLPTQAYNALSLIESPTFADGSNDGCSAYPANYFRRPQSASGAQGIAVLRLDQNASNCGSGARRTSAANAGALAVLYVDPEYINLGATGASYSMLSEDWTAIKAAVGDVSGTTGTATGSISYPTAATPRAADRVTGFSSRGPTQYGTLKPDISAPGDIILAALSPTAANGYNNPAVASTMYGTESGTSMATPHIAGSAALVRQVHRDWTPMEVKSALMTTSKSALTLGDGVTPANPNQKGSGRIDLTIAAKAGLVFNETGANFQAANPAAGGKPETLNLASYYHADCVGSCVFPRTVRSTGKSTTWTVAVSGLPSGSYSLDKTTFTLGGSGLTSYKLTVNAAALTLGQWYYGDLSLTPSDASIPTAHLPIAIRPATAKLAVDSDAIAATVTMGTTQSRNVVISNAGNPTLDWSIPATLKGVIVNRKPSNNGLTDRTVVTAATASAIESTNANNAYGADWFDIFANGTTLAEIQMSGFGCAGLSCSGGYPAVDTFATQFAWRVWADNNGVPNGRPGKTVAGDADPVWQFPAAAGGLPPNAAGLSFQGNDVALDLAAAGASQTPLAAGRYWLGMAPSVVGTGTVYYQMLTQEAGKTVPGQYALPNAASAANKAWRPTTTVGGAGYTGYAMKVSVNALCGAPWMSYDNTSGSLGLAGSKTVAVTFDATGLAVGTYKAYLCVSGNGTSPPSDLGVGSDSQLVPVTLNVVPVAGALAVATSAAMPDQVQPGDSTQLSVVVTPATNPGSTGIVVKADLSSIGGSAAQVFALTSGTTYAYTATVDAATAQGIKSFPVTVTDAQGHTATSAIGLAVGTAAAQPLGGSGIAAPASAHPGDSTLLIVSVVPATNPASTGVTVTGDLSAIGGSATQAFYDDGSHGDAVAGDGLYSFSAPIDAGTTVGAKSLLISIADAQARTKSTSIGLDVTAAPTALSASSAGANPAVVVAGATTHLSVAVAAGTSPPSTGVVVKGDLSSIGGSANQAFVGDGNGTYTFDATVAAATTPGVKLVPVTISDAQGRTADATIGLSVPTPGSPAGAGIASPSSVLPGNTALLMVATTPGSNPASTGLAVSVDLSSIGGSATQAFYDDGTHGDQTAGDGVFSFQATLDPGTPIGTTLNLVAMITDAQSRSGSAVIVLDTLSDRIFANGFEEN